MKRSVVLRVISILVFATMLVVVLVESQIDPQQAAKEQHGGYPLPLKRIGWDALMELQP